MQKVIGKTIKTEAEISSGLLRPEFEDKGNMYYESPGEWYETYPPPQTPPHDGEAIDFEIILTRLDALTSTERSVLGLLYGLEGHAVIPPSMVAKKLGRDDPWVCRKRAAAISRLRAELGLDGSRSISSP